MKERNSSLKKVWISGLFVALIYFPCSMILYKNGSLSKAMEYRSITAFVLHFFASPILLSLVNFFLIALPAKSSSNKWWIPGLFFSFLYLAWGSLFFLLTLI